MANKTPSEKLAARFAALNYDGISPASRHAVKRLLLDFLGVALGGSQTGSGKIARRFATEQGGQPQSRLIGDSARVPMANAAFANAISSHSIELDDIDVLALFHFSPPVYGSGIAVAEGVGASGKQLITALAAGCEMMERASTAANPSLRNRGFHTTPTCGVFGATVAAGKLLGLNAEKLTSALGLAGAQSGGLMEMYGPSMQKRFNPGPAARSGVTSARMAQLGFTGTASIFDGERGFLKAFADQTRPDALDPGTAKRYELKIEFKPYSSARPIHNAIDCALDIRQQLGFDVTKVKSIRIARHPDWAHYHQNRTPATYHEAQVSLPFSFAVALIEGKALLAQYTDRNIRSAKLRRLSSLAQFEPDASLPRGVSCRITVTQDDGKQFVSQIDYPKGSIENPMSDDELFDKFASLAGPVLGPRRVQTLADAVMSVEQMRDVAELMKLTSARAVRAAA